MLKKSKSKSRKLTHLDFLIDENNQSIINLVIEKYKSNFEQKHLSLSSTKEHEYLNTKDVNSCPHCGSTTFIKSGKNSNQIQIYYCKNCRHYFTPTTGSLFANHKIEISEMTEFLLNIFRFQSIESASRNNKNSWTTGRYWLEKVFYVLRNYQNNLILSDKIYVDEFYINDPKTEYIINDKNNYDVRGFNSYCLCVATDKLHTIALLKGKGKLKANNTNKFLKEHVVSNSKLIHSSKNNYKDLIENLSLIDLKFNLSKIKYLPMKRNPLEPINSRKRSLKYFLNVHNGIKFSNMQDYLNLYCFIINPPHNLFLKVTIILDLLLNTKKVIKYRDFYAKSRKSNYFKEANN